MKYLSILFHPIHFFLIITIFVGLCPLGCDSDKPIRIGFIASLSGRVAYLGSAGRNAVQLAVEQCNEKGGIHGHRVELIAKDDRQSDKIAVQAFRELIKAEVEVIIGPMTSNMAMVITPYLNEARIVAVSPTISTDRLSGIDDYFFRVTPATNQAAILSADYQIRSERARKFVAIYDNSNLAYCESWLKSFKNRFVAGGGQITAVVAFEKSENRSFLEIVQSTLANDSDGILIIANAMDSALICHQIRKSDPDITIMLAAWGATDRLIELGGNAVEGVTVVRNYDRDSPNPAYQAFRKIYLERYRKAPGFPGVHGYDAAQVVLTALSARKDKQSVKESILSIGEFDGLQSQIIFDAYGDVNRSNTSISIVRNRKFVIVE